MADGGVGDGGGVVAGFAQHQPTHREAMFADLIAAEVENVPLHSGVQPREEAEEMSDC
ncbi:hypothetical protein [Jiangella ureilytica]|uniref:hypothetical protein n=1 Tax=Jiangella ureilytica TaxID=2530374 RepID=UPI0013A5E3B3|nr:hypothetical protein [Jiangella ureilytica]